ncbi:UvrB/uvrC motif family protein [Trichomonas vaginalis G3]|uniref:Centrosomal protein of 104 kDa n=1 Tax=Trichomonas vaginalis (strain ATCC PRA-98 / G3) TaxID=412133 RepID=A2DLW8_TRIV3|nr:glycine-, glutamate-, thienylcyclohexylpiperidine-binding protein family [Trichomonas vaginalis G3]EAY18571.1 UvrB/uvrC motif family protein [Trichomonas vaginalis G3]KAI5491598.1 glycine-, glutamate-, thienylcyclohexylpiperidine-binding protein family [Trichomonas vaginalis G3]|eukprot:XP_001579557.1 UvrB/uvrC motif family protein [Trichomonas vaginalis G3]
MDPESLDYTIVSCSSEDPHYPITSIQNASIRSNGWQSQQNPSYPVSFVVDLGSKAEIKSLQFVSHQSKIPARVDLSYGDNGTLFKPLGSFQFSDNSQTGYSARELKSANLSKVSTRFFKISIRGCHTNASNPFNQVGIVSLKILGNGGRPASSQRPTTPELDLEQEINKLERQKADAVAREDFSEANNIKIRLNELKSQKETLENLKKRKAEAIAAEDFEMARIVNDQLKAFNNKDYRPYTTQAKPREEIVKYDNNYNSARHEKQPPKNIEPPRGRQIPNDDDDNSPIPSSKDYELPDSFDNDASPAGCAIPRDSDESPRPGRSIPRDNDDIPPPGRSIPRDEKDVSRRDHRIIEPVEDDEDQVQDLEEEPPEPAKPMKKGKYGMTRPILGGNMDQAPPQNDYEPADLSEERPIHPADDYNEDPNGGLRGITEDSSTPDELTPASRQEASLLISKFGEDAVARFYSKNWQLRIEGINILGKRIKELGQVSCYEAFCCFCKIMRFRMSDTQKAIVSDGIQVIQDIADTNVIQNGDLARAVQSMLAPMATRIGGNSQPISEAVCNFLVFLCSNGCSDIVLPIIYGGKKNSANWKSLQARISCLHDIVLFLGMDAADGLSLDQMMKLAVEGLESAKSEVRLAATQLVVTLEEMAGSAIEKYIEKIPKRTREEVSKAIEQNHQKNQNEEM